MLEEAKVMEDSATYYATAVGRVNGKQILVQLGNFNLWTSAYDITCTGITSHLTTLGVCSEIITALLDRLFEELPIERPEQMFTVVEICHTSSDSESLSLLVVVQADIS